MDAQWRVTFRSDHRFSLAPEDDSGASPPFLLGRWLLEGDELVLTVTRYAKDSKEKPPEEFATPMRKRIVEFGRDQFRVYSEYPYVRVP